MKKSLLLVSYETGYLQDFLYREQGRTMDIKPTPLSRKAEKRALEEKKRLGPVVNPALGGARG